MALVLGHDFGTSKSGAVAEYFRLVNPPVAHRVVVSDNCFLRAPVSELHQT
jgi:hypothetical protein